MKHGKGTTAYADRLSTTLSKIKQADGVHVEEATTDISPMSEAERQDMLEDIGRSAEMELPKKLRDYLFVEDPIALCWDYELDGRQENGGEFSLKNLFDVIAMKQPRLWAKIKDEADKAFWNELRPFDSHPVAGDGAMAALRVQGDALKDKVWFVTTGGERFEMDLGYDGYLDALLDTRGYFGWQYLFTDVDLRSRNDDLADRLETMLEDLPRLFPDTDIAPYRARLDKLRRRK